MDAEQSLSFHGSRGPAALHAPVCRHTHATQVPLSSRQRGAHGDAAQSAFALHSKHTPTDGSQYFAVELPAQSASVKQLAGGPLSPQ